MIEIKGCWNPTIIKAGGAIYAVSGSTWLRVPKNTTKKDLKWINTSPSPKKHGNNKEWEIKDYIVSLKYGYYSCTCLGYLYRRRCKHVTQVSNQYNKRRGE